VARLAAWIGIALLAAYLVFVGGSGDGSYTADLRMVTALVAAGTLGAWLLVAVRHEAWRPRSVLMPAIVAALLSMGVATVFSRIPRVSAEYLAFGIVLAALYLLLVRLMASPFFRVRLVFLSSGLFLLISTAYIVVVVIRWATWLRTVGHLTVPPLRPDFESLTFDNPANLLMMVALLAVPTVAGVSWGRRRGVALGALAIGLTAVVALMSGTRAGWLALAVAGLVGASAFVVALRSGLRREGWARSVWHSRAWRAAVVAGFGLVVVAALLFAPAILRRASEGGEALRGTFVAIALRLFSEAPVTGTGLGTWAVQRIAQTRPGETDYYIPHAHNIYVQTLAEQGLIGALAGAVVALSLVWLLINGISSGGTRRQWAIVTLIGLVYFGVHETLDFMLNIPAVLFALAIPIAYLDATTEAAPPWHRWVQPRPTIRNAARWVALGLTGIALAGIVLQEIPGRLLDQAVTLANVGRWSEARQPALQAAAMDPDISAYGFTAGLVEAHAGNHAAAAAFFRRVAQHDDLPEAWINLAQEDLASGNQGAVSESIAEALRLGRQRPAISMAAGDLAMRIGDEATAKDAFVAAVSNTPSLLADPWWRDGGPRQTLLGAVALSAIELAPPDRAWEFALMSGDATRARSLTSDPEILNFIGSWQGDSAALDRLRASCAAQPLNIGLIQLCARAEGRVGNVDRANDLRYIADAQVGGAFTGGAETRVNEGPVLGQDLAGNPAFFWGTYTYRRPTPWDVLVPGLVHLTLTLR
jgi:O-antigen ligase/tetratricopeptide (TPR) repeat protein